MERIPNEALENAIDVYKFAMETCLKNKVEDYVPTLDKATISFLEELKAYRDAEEQGLLLRLPFEAGKEIYVITKSFDVTKNSMSNIIEVFEVKEFKYNFLKNFVIVGRQRKNGYYERHFFLWEIGKTVFLTKEEAEQKLAEMGGDNNV